MRLNQKTIPHKKLINVKKNWLMVPLVSMVLNSSTLVSANDEGIKFVQNSESFLSALKNKDVHSIYLEHDINLKNQSLINELPRRDLSIDLSSHRLDWGDSEWQFINDTWDEPSKIKIQFLNGYLDKDEVDRMQKYYDDGNSQIDVELNKIDSSSLKNNVENDNSDWSSDFEKLPVSSNSNHQLDSSFVSSANKNTIEDWASEEVSFASSTSTSAIQNSSSSQTNVDLSGADDKISWDGNDSNTSSQNNDSSHPNSSATETSSESISSNSYSAATSKAHSFKDSQDSSNFASSNSSAMNSSSSAGSAYSNGLQTNGSNVSVSSNSLNSFTSNTSAASSFSSSNASSSSVSSVLTPILQKNKDLLQNDFKLLDYLNMIPSLKNNLSSDYYSKNDFYQSISKILQSLSANQDSLDQRLKALETSQSQTQSSSAFINRTAPFAVASHKVKVKQKCYVYPDATFDISKRMRLATNEELADLLIKEHAYSKYGRLRYKVKDGFITANPKFVQNLN